MRLGAAYCNYKIYGFYKNGVNGVDGAAPALILNS